MIKLESGGFFKRIFVILLFTCQLMHAYSDEKKSYDEQDNTCIYYYNSTFLKSVDMPDLNPVNVGSVTNVTTMAECCEHCTNNEDCYIFIFAIESDLCLLYNTVFNTNIYTTQALGVFMGIAITK
jgi:hypothetical protein